MATSYSSLLRLELPGNGEQSGIWGSTTNNNLGTLLDQAIAGTASITMLDADYTLSAYNGVTDEARQMILNVGGTLTANRNIICPATSKLYVIKNNTTGGFSVTLKTASGTGVTVTNGNTTIAYCDNTNVVDSVTALPAGTTVGTLPIVTTTGTQTLTNKTLTAPKFADGGFIADANGNEIVILDTVTSAVNEITVANAATGAGPSVSATGSDSNINLNLVPKGTGVVSVSGSVNVSGNQVISVTDNTNAALRVTQLGTGNAILVEDSTNPDATPFVVTADGNVGVGLTNPSVQLQVVGTASQNRLWLGSAAITNRQLFVRSNGTFAAPTIVASGDAVGSANFFGYDGAANIELANITATVDGTPGTNDMPGRLTFSTTADGASSTTERFRIGSAGQLGIGGANYGTSSQFLRSGGASAAPSWVFLGGISFTTTTGAAITASTGVTVSRLGAGSYLVTHNIGSTSYIPVVSAHIPLIGDTGSSEGIPRPVSGQYVVSAVGTNSFRIDTYVREFEQIGDDNVNTFVTESAYEWSGAVYVTILGV